MHLKKGVGRGGVCKVYQCACGFVCVLILFSTLYIGAKWVYTDTVSSELVVPVPYVYMTALTVVIMTTTLLYIACFCWLMHVIFLTFVQCNVSLFSLSFHKLMS